MKKLLIISIVLTALLLSACSPGTIDGANEMINDTPEQFESNMKGEYLLLDVRTQGEYDEGHINDPTLIPVDELESRLAEIEEYKNLPVLVYCRSGNRSATAAKILLDNGFQEVHNLLGGIGAWNEYKSQ